MQAVGYLMEGEQQILAGANMQKRIANPRYLAAAARYKMGTILGNAGNMADSNKWLHVSRDGKSMYAVPQNRHDDYSGGPNWLILDQATGKQIGIVDSLNGFGIHKKTKGGDGSGKEGAIDKRLEREILAGGFVKKDGWYYEPNADGEKVDLTKPLSSEAVRMFRDKLAGGGLGGQGNGAGSQSGNSLGLTRPGSAPPPQAAAPGSTPAQGVAGALASPAQPQQAPAQPQRQTEPASPQDLDYATSEDMKNWKNIELVSRLMPNGSYLTYGKTPDGRSIYLRPETARKIRENSRAASVERHKNDPTDFGIVPETF
jgi:hypothetical protein